MKRTVISIFLLCIGVMMMAQMPLGKGQLKVSKVARNAVRIQYTEEEEVKSDLPDWLYVKHDEVESQDISTQIDAQGQILTINDKNGKPTSENFNKDKADLNGNGSIDDSDIQEIANIVVGK